MKYLLALILLCLTLPAYAGSSSIPTGCSVSNNGVVWNGDTGLGCGAPTRQITTVGSLPSCATATKGAMYLVTDSLVPVALATVAGSGAVIIGVTCNGTNWIVQ